MLTGMQDIVTWRCVQLAQGADDKTVRPATLVEVSLGDLSPFDPVTLPEPVWRIDYQARQVLHSAGSWSAGRPADDYVPCLLLALLVQGNRDALAAFERHGWDPHSRTRSLQEHLALGTIPPLVEVEPAGTLDVPPLPAISMPDEAVAQLELWLGRYEETPERGWEHTMGEAAPELQAVAARLGLPEDIRCSLQRLLRDRLESAAAARDPHYVHWDERTGYGNTMHANR